MRIAFLFSLTALAAGLVIVFTMQTLFGVLLIIGAVGGLGYVAFIGGIERVAVFLSTGTWRR